MARMKVWALLVLSSLPVAAISHRSSSPEPSESAGRIIVSRNGRYLQYEDGRPFFWLGDTGWLLFQKLNREESIRYLEDRKQKGFTVVQCVIVQSVPSVNCYGDSAFVNNDPARPASPRDSALRRGNGYWEHIDFILDKARELDIHVALVPVWGSVVRSKYLTTESARTYARFLAERFRARPNIVWMNGGDDRGEPNRKIWETIGSTLKKYDPDHLLTFHPFGRTQSSTWFHAAPWLDFNMFQSGHRRYDQDDTPKRFGEDNWRYVQDDWKRTPPKPTLDGEPSYENILQGLHDTTQPYWTANDVRRYAYWSVFVGACGHTYGNNAIMQMYRPGDKPAYGVRNSWQRSLADPGAAQMHYLKQLMLSRPYFERVGDQALVAQTGNERYKRVIATRGSSYAMFYSFVGEPFQVKMGRISGGSVKAWWYDPRTGTASEIGVFGNSGTRRFDPPSGTSQGNDWVLVLDDAAKRFGRPGTGVK